MVASPSVCLLPWYSPTLVFEWDVYDFDYVDEQLRRARTQSKEAGEKGRSIPQAYVVYCEYCDTTVTVTFHTPAARAQGGVCRTAARRDGGCQAAQLCRSKLWVGILAMKRFAAWCPSQCGRVGATSLMVRMYGLSFTKVVLGA